MKICVYGLWHLGSVTAACLAEAGFQVIGLDNDVEVVKNLAQGRPPLFEPGLEALIKKGLAADALTFTADALIAVKEADAVWITFDTPVDEDDRADTTFILDQIQAVFPHLKDQAIVLISSQMPVGSTAALEKSFLNDARGRHVEFAYSPENLRLGRAIEVFKAPGRIVIGTRNDRTRAALTPLLERFCDTLLWISVESAEMSKHALNAFLATSVTFINEIATLCERVGADAAEVEAALRSEPRIGKHAYIRPGTAFAGGTLARDVAFLTEIAKNRALEVPLLDAVLPSNRAHQNWAFRQLSSCLKDLRKKEIAVLGLSYKPGTDTLRRSSAVELCRNLADAGATVRAYDPAVRRLPGDLQAVVLCPDMATTVQGADALVVATEWPEFKNMKTDVIGSRMRRPLIIDQNRFLPAPTADSKVEYVTLGKPL